MIFWRECCFNCPVKDGPPNRNNIQSFPELRYGVWRFILGCILRDKTTHEKLAKCEFLSFNFSSSYFITSNTFKLYGVTWRGVTWQKSLFFLFVRLWWKDFLPVSRLLTRSMVALRRFSSLGNSQRKSALSRTSCLWTLVNWSKLFSRKEIFCRCAAEPPSSDTSSLDLHNQFNGL